MRSEILPVADTGGQTCAFEFVPSARKAKAIYVVFDGRRIAYRGDPNGPHAKRWVTMVPGYEVIDEASDQLAVYFAGEVLQ